MRNLSPLARRRLERFRSNRRGWWSLWLFCGLFALTLGGELIANDKPLLVSYQHSLYFPVFKRYTEQQFGGELPFQPDYRSDYVRQLIAKGDGWMIFPPIPFSDDTPNYELTTPAPSPPSASNWLGTDDQARDVLARVIFGARISILFALVLTAISALIGITAGALQGYYGGWVDLFGQRLLEVWSGLPVCRVPARAQSGVRQSRPRTWSRRPKGHPAAHSAQCHERNIELLAIHPDWRHIDPHRAGFSGFRHAGR
ncbi:hypothetical protein ALP71_03106 [Pseudomonas coronafaciens pv. garcae]|nr:hypothetical protein ALP71_03106 [Pseudomonas coronafaciens pv. garcae]